MTLAAGSRLVGVIAVLAVLGACSDDVASPDTSPGSSSVAQSPAFSVPGSASPADVLNPPPRVDLIAEAVAAIEAELGGPQQYFEINATPRLVNLFVALNNAAVAQPWVYFDGSLTSQEGQPAQGNTFGADAVDFDPQSVLSGVVDELPTSAFDAFIIDGGPAGAVRYSVVVSSTAGGQLVVIVDPAGKVLSVETV